jgi:hypothetical protein
VVVEGAKTYFPKLRRKKNRSTYRKIVTTWVFDGHYPDSDLVGIRNRKPFIGIDDAVLSHGHGVALDVLRYAFCGALSQVETHRMRGHCQN